MRLLKVFSMKFVEYANERDVPRYGILSHRWDRGEMTYQDMITANPSQKLGYAKVKAFCNKCALDGLSLAWIDTCCIDRSSSAELSEAINSMYRWYGGAARCYVYIADFNINEPHEHEKLDQSEWFERGWTLQELIAPDDVHFYDRSWSSIGTKRELSGRVSKITNIPENVLHGEDIEHYSIAQRMSWASRRKTTRIEDQAYSLMGIFAVNMPMLYGEGERAFIRLQEEIMKHSVDHSIFAWPGSVNPYERAELYHITDQRLEGLLATSPVAFTYCGNIQKGTGIDQDRSFSLTNLGLAVDVVLRQRSIDVYQAKLNCYFGTNRRLAISIFVKQTERDGQYERHILNGTYTEAWSTDEDESLPVQINVKQGPRKTSMAVCAPMMVFNKGPATDFDTCTPFRNEMQTLGKFNADTGVLGLHNDFSMPVALLRSISSDQPSQTALFQFGFDFYFNPYLRFRIISSTDDPAQYSSSRDVACDRTIMYHSVDRLLHVAPSVDDLNSSYVFKGHRVDGLLVCFADLNATVNLQKKAVASLLCWTVDIQKADPHVQGFLSLDRVSAQLPCHQLLPFIDPEIIEENDLCSICRGFLTIPALTDCVHQFCQACTSWAGIHLASIQLTQGHLNQTSTSGADCTGMSIVCPICGSVTFGYFDRDRHWSIQTKYPVTYRQMNWIRTINADEFPALQILTFVVGNTHKITHVLLKGQTGQSARERRHDYTFFLRPSGIECVAHVKVILHETYKNREVDMFQPPFEVRRIAWGNFTVRVEITLKIGYSFYHEHAIVDQNGQSKLRLEWDLDFDGDGSQGWMKIVVERLKPHLSDHDLKLRAQASRLRSLQAAALLHRLTH